MQEDGSLSNESLAEGSRESVNIESLAEGSRESVNKSASIDEILAEKEESRIRLQTLKRLKL